MPTKPETTALHPGVYVRRLLESNELNVTEGAKVLRVSRVTLSRMLTGEAALSGDMAVRLSKAFGLRVESLMQMQCDYDLALTLKRARRIHVQPYRRTA